MSDENDGNFITDAFGAIGSLYEDAGNFLTKDDNPLSRFTNLALSAAVAKYAQPQQEKLGYQGKVDMDKQRVRERVPMQQSQNAGRDLGILSLSQLISI